jgi:predicted NUDIX family NTP pyrophosphohydrolase
MSKQSAGIILYRFKNKTPQVLLVRPGGPFWAKKNIGNWSIPKGEIEENENAFAAAKRETSEETGIHFEHIDHSLFIELSPVKIKSGKTIFAWAIEEDFDTNEMKSNFFEMEWPPKSGQRKRFPEVDSAEWFSIEEAKDKVNKGQVPMLDELAEKLK